MGKCSVCGKDDSKAFLFMPSDVFVFLCDKHAVERINGDSSVPISEWVESQRKRFINFKKIVEYLEAIQTKGKKDSSE